MKAGRAALRAAIPAMLVAFALAGPSYAGPSSSSNGLGQTSTTQNATGGTMVAPDATLPCAPAGTCGSFTIGSAGLVVAGDGAGSSALLSMTIMNTSADNATIASLAYFIDGQQVGQTAGLPPGETITYTVLVPPSVDLEAGQVQAVRVEGVVDGSTVDRSTNVVPDAGNGAAIDPLFSPTDILLEAALVVLLLGSVLFYRRHP